MKIRRVVLTEHGEHNPWDICVKMGKVDKTDKVYFTHEEACTLYWLLKDFYTKEERDNAKPIEEDNTAAE